MQYLRIYLVRYVHGLLKVKTSSLWLMLHHYWLIGMKNFITFYWYCSKRLTAAYSTTHAGLTLSHRQRTVRTCPPPSSDRITQAMRLCVEHVLMAWQEQATLLTDRTAAEVSWSFKSGKDEKSFENVSKFHPFLTYSLSQNTYYVFCDAVLKRYFRFWIYI